MKIKLEKQYLVCESCVKYNALQTQTLSYQLISSELGAIAPELIDKIVSGFEGVNNHFFAVLCDKTGTNPEVIEYSAKPCEVCCNKEEGVRFTLIP